MRGRFLDLSDGLDLLPRWRLDDLVRFGLDGLLGFLLHLPNFFRLLFLGAGLRPSGLDEGRWLGDLWLLGQHGLSGFLDARSSRLLLGPRLGRRHVPGIRRLLAVTNLFGGPPLIVLFLSAIVSKVWYLLVGSAGEEEASQPVECEHDEERREQGLLFGK